MILLSGIILGFYIGGVLVGIILYFATLALLFAYFAKIKEKILEMKKRRRRFSFWRF